MPNRPIEDPKHWYDRAANMRAIADGIANDDTVELMRRLADDYDKLGDRAAERRSGAAPH